MKKDPALQKALSNVVRMNLDEALTQKPVYTLQEILPHKTVAELRSLARINRISACGKMKKAELISALSEALPNPEIMKPALCCLEQQEWDFFQKVAGQRQLADNLIFVDSFLATQEFGYLQAFFDDGKMVFVVPEEIRNVFTEMIHDGTAAVIERSILIDRYARAAVNLYGIIPFDELLALFNQQNTEKTTEDELFSTLLQYIDEDSDYCFWEEYLVHSDFEDNDFQGVAVLEKAVMGKERYTPAKEKFLQYADSDYSEPTPQVEQLETYLLANLVTDSRAAFDIVQEIALACMAEAPIKEIMDVFDQFGVEFSTKAQVEQLMPYITGIWNNSRIWLNKGHTPSEMRNIDERPLLRVLPGGDKRPGRNDPCPCGSGKKYKKCCGRND